jgi:hypothetical protein
MIGFMFNLFKKQDEVATGRNIKEMDFIAARLGRHFLRTAKLSRPDALSAFGANR